MNRTPPTEVMRTLRQEVGFGCHVPGCGNPYLHWHHFDPPWHIRQHHDPAGMIALCSEHHGKADAGAFTWEQLNAFKATAQDRPVGGRFDWLRRDLIVRVGTNFSFKTPTVLTYGPHPLIWFTRDAEQHLLVNIQLANPAGDPRPVMRESYWVLSGKPVDVVSPRSGKNIDIKYQNGDRVRVDFKEVMSEDEGLRRFPKLWPSSHITVYPATICDLTYRIAGTTIDIGPSHFKVGGSSFRHCTYTECGPISLGEFPGAMLQLHTGAILLPRSARRNDLCPCGSNVKFKKCCGALGVYPRAAADPTGREGFW